MDTSPRQEQGQGHGLELDETFKVREHATLLVPSRLWPACELTRNGPAHLPDLTGPAFDSPLSCKTQFSGTRRWSVPTLIPRGARKEHGVNNNSSRPSVINFLLPRPPFSPFSNSKLDVGDWGEDAMEP